jgi:exosortase
MAFGGALLLIALLWSYWATLQGLWSDWQEDANYSVGQLVPLAALYLLWHRRDRLRGVVLQPNWWGAAVVLAAQGGRAFGLVLVYGSAERYSFVLTLAGLVLWIGGTHLFRRLFWILVFLLLMVPLPGQVHNVISGPLQTLATAGAVFLLEIIGVPAVRDGHVIMLNASTPLAVAEACSGLRMLTAFVVVGSALAFLVSRPVWQKAVLVASTVPVAIACNLVRLVATAVLFMWFDSTTAEKFFHDFAGWTMMPLAVAMLMAELWLLGRIEPGRSGAN